MLHTFSLSWIAYSWIIDTLWALIPERHQRIHARRASRGQITGHCRDYQQRQYGQTNGDRVGGADSEKLTGDQARRRQSRRNAQRGADQDQPQRIAQREPERVTTISAERHSYADFLRALRDGVG